MSEQCFAMQIENWQTNRLITEAWTKLAEQDYYIVLSLIEIAKRHGHIINYGKQEKVEAFLYERDPRAKKLIMETQNE